MSHKTVYCSLMDTNSNKTKLINASVENHKPTHSEPYRESDESSSSGFIKPAVIHYTERADEPQQQQNSRLAITHRWSSFEGQPRNAGSNDNGNNNVSQQDHKTRNICKLGVRHDGNHDIQNEISIFQRDNSMFARTEDDIREESGHSHRVHVPKNMQLPHSNQQNIQRSTQGFPLAVPSPSGSLDEVNNNSYSHHSNAIAIDEFPSCTNPASHIRNVTDDINGDLKTNVVYM